MDLEPEEKKKFQREGERGIVPRVQYSTADFRFFVFCFFVSLDCLLLSCSDSNDNIMVFLCTLWGMVYVDRSLFCFVAEG